MAKKKHKKTGKRLLIWLFTAVAAVAIVAGIFFSMYFPFKTMMIRRDSRELDLRGYALTVEEFQALQEKIPQCRILWRIPIGEDRFDSTAQEISLKQLDMAQAERFYLFENLQRIRAGSLECYEELEQMAALLPGCRIEWGVHIGGEVFSREDTALDLSGKNPESAELLAELKWLENLEQVALPDVHYTAQEREALREAYPNVVFTWPLEAAGKTWLSTDAALSYAGQKLDVKALTASAGEFYNVEALDVSGCGLTIEELLQLREAFPEARIESELTLFGQDITTAVEELDLSGIEMEDTSELERVLPLLHSLTWVDMCDCGISNEEMDRLNKQYDPIRFVWKVHFTVYTLRTDATYFCASDLPGNGYVAIKMTDEQLEPLKYCEDLIALDLGHMRYTDLSFLENMPKLQFLILVEAKFTDISPIGTLKDLKYLEIFVNTIDDISPLLQCPALKHLNIGYTTGFDTSVLQQLTGLERLWYPGNSMSDEEIEALKAALPDTLCHLPEWDPDGSTGNGWREADIYFEMRNIFNMHYMPGGTGMGKDE